MVEQDTGCTNTTINSTLGRLDEVESTIANVVEAIADMKIPEPAVETPAPAVVAPVIQSAPVQVAPAPTPAVSSSNIAELLTELSTEQLRTLSGQVMAELRKRKAASTAPVAATPAAAKRKPTKSADEKAASKTAYLEKKAEYASREFGVICTSTGKTLKRRFASEVDALTAADALSVQMKRSYAVTLLAAAA